MPPMRNEQERNLLIVKAVGIALALLLLPIGMALYLGWDLPPHGMREYYTSATGYATPPKKVPAPVGTVPRGALSLVGPAEQQSLRSRVGVGVGGPVPTPTPTRSLSDRSVAPSVTSLRNPLAGDRGAITLGRKAYAVNCAMCHGEPGRGIGPVGELYTPRPPDLSTHVPAHSAGELYSVITDGIRSTPTPEAARYLPREWHAFRDRTSARERWAMVTYLKATLQR